MVNAFNSITTNAASGLQAAQAGISVISDNIANAGVAGYTAKQQDLSTFEVGGQSNGVVNGLVSRSVDAALQASVWTSASKVGSLTVQSTVLQAVNATQGVPGDGTSLADAVSALQSSFTLLQAQPSAPTQQSAVVAAATTLAGTINSTANAITQQRNGVQNQIVSAVNTVNTALATVQSTTQAIITATSAGQSTADLEDQRDQALQTLSSEMDLHYDKQANGNITILGHNGFSIPLDSRLSTTTATLAPASTYAVGSASVPPVLLQSANPAVPAVDVTGMLAGGGGALGGLVQLRDTTLPAYTATLDTFSAQLAGQFSSQGLQLFTDGSATTPLVSYAGLSSQIQVNPAVVATPSQVRDGNLTTSTFTPNPSSGPASFSTLIDSVVNSSFAASGATPSLQTMAQNFVSQQSNATAQVGTNLTAATSYQTTLSSRLSDGSAVNVDQQMGLMIQLQNSYQANARVIETTTTLFNALLGAMAVV